MKKKRKLAYHLTICLQNQVPAMHYTLFKVLK